MIDRFSRTGEQIAALHDYAAAKGADGSKLDRLASMLESPRNVSVGEILSYWREACAFVIGGDISSSFSIQDEVKGHEDELDGPFDTESSFYVFGEHGIRREYFITPEMIEGGKLVGDELTVNYDGEFKVSIAPLFVATRSQEEELAIKAAYDLVFDTPALRAEMEEADLTASQYIDGIYELQDPSSERLT